MAKMDLASNMYSYNTVTPKVVTTNQTGIGVDAQGYESVTFVLATGAYTDGNYAVQLEDSDDNTTYTPVLASSGLLINVENFPYSATSTDYKITSLVSQNEVFWVGYAGPKRYVRGRIYANGATSGMLFAGSILLGSPHSAPTQ